MSTAEEPVVCTLTTKAAASQLMEWTDLQQAALRVQAVPAGVMMRFPGSLEPQVADLVTREAACCAFLDIMVTGVGDDIEVTITSENPDAQPVIAALSGLSA